MNFNHLFLLLTTLFFISIAARGNFESREEDRTDLSFESSEDTQMCFNPNEQWYDCGVPCERKCSQRRMKKKPCRRPCIKHLCRCKAGYFRNDLDTGNGKCVRRHECDE